MTWKKFLKRFLNLLPWMLGLQLLWFFGASWAEQSAVMSVIHGGLFVVLVGMAVYLQVWFVAILITKFRNKFVVDKGAVE